MPGGPAYRVFGVLFTLSPDDRPALDRAEDLHHGYADVTVDVQVEGRTLRALTYVAIRKDPDLLPFDWYRNIVVAGAREHGLPAAWIDLVRSVAVRTDDNEQRRTLHEALLRGRRAADGEIE